MTKVITQGYIGNTKWHYTHWQNNEYLIGWFYKGQLEKRNIVSLYPTATIDNLHYYTNDGKPIPKLVYRALVEHQQQASA